MIDDIKIREVELVLDGEYIDSCTGTGILGSDGTNNHDEPADILFERVSPNVVSFRPCRNHLSWFMKASKDFHWGRFWKLVE